MYYSYVEIEYVATSFSPARTDLALKLLKAIGVIGVVVGIGVGIVVGVVVVYHKYSRIN
jgi:hypothetical protein